MRLCLWWTLPFSSTGGSEESKTKTITSIPDSGMAHCFPNSISPTQNAQTDQDWAIEKRNMTSDRRLNNVGSNLGRDGCFPEAQPSLRGRLRYKKAPRTTQGNVTYNWHNQVLLLPIGNVLAGDTTMPHNAFHQVL